MYLYKSMPRPTPEDTEIRARAKGHITELKNLKKEVTFSKKKKGQPKLLETAMHNFESATLKAARDVGAYRAEFLTVPAVKKLVEHAQQSNAQILGDPSKLLKLLTKTQTRAKKVGGTRRAHGSRLTRRR
jgi:sulfur relay (sulfurtransferase) DsrC/TusE family protein